MHILILLQPSVLLGRSLSADHTSPWRYLLCSFQKGLKSVKIVRAACVVGHHTNIIIKFMISLYLFSLSWFLLQIFRRFFYFNVFRFITSWRPPSLFISHAGEIVASDWYVQQINPCDALWTRDFTDRCTWVNVRKIQLGQLNFISDWWVTWTGCRSATNKTEGGH